MALDIGNKTFVLYIVTVIKPNIMLIYNVYKTQIVLLIEAKIFVKYFKFSNIFSLNSITELLK